MGQNMTSLCCLMGAKPRLCFGFVLSAVATLSLLLEAFDLLTIVLRFRLWHYIMFCVIVIVMCIS